jgi:hypothetical protein
VVRGEQRTDIDEDLLVQALLMIGEQRQREEAFFEWLIAQNERVAAGSLYRLRWPVIMLDGTIFALFDGGHLVCCLAEDDRAEALKLKGARLFAPLDGERIYQEWVRLPEDAGRAEWEHYGLAALRYADQCLTTEHDEPDR